MLRQFQFIVVNTLSLLVSVNTYAFEVSKEFSANAVQVAPGRVPVYSKMFVSKDAVRTELMQQGKMLVDIAYPEKGKRVLLNPEQKTYMEMSSLPVTKSLSSIKAKTPCEGVPGTSCKSLGKEKVYGITTEKWQVERKVNGKTFRSLHWIDNSRRLAVKEMLPDGSVSELVMQGKSDLNGRQVEQWESRISQPSGQNQVSRQWYDLQLRIVIREEMDGGYMRELNNIKVGEQDKKLFEIPAGFKKIDVKKQ